MANLERATKAIFPRASLHIFQTGQQGIQTSDIPRFTPQEHARAAQRRESPGASNDALIIMNGCRRDYILANLHIIPSERETHRNLHLQKSNIDMDATPTHRDISASKHHVTHNT